MAIVTFIGSPQNVVVRICAEATAIPKGTLMKLSGTNTVIATSGDNDVFGGVTIEEFTGGENLTHVSCAMGGVCQMTTTAAAIALGIPVSIGGANAVIAEVASDFVLGTHVGHAEEARTGTNSIRVRLRGH